MEKRFVNRTELDFAACRALARQAARKVTLALWAAVAVIAVCTAIMWFMGSARAPQFTGFLAIVFAYALLKDFLYGAMMYRGYNHKHGAVEYIFGEEDIAMRSNLEDTRLQYGGIVKVTEDKHYFFLYVNKSSALVLAKKGFTEGKSENFAAFLSGKSLGRILHKPLRGRRRRK